jgi:hypothetical protein
MATAPASLGADVQPRDDAVHLLVDIDTRGCVPNDPRVGVSSLCSTFLKADLLGDGTPQNLVFYVAGTATRRSLAEALWTVELRAAAGTWKTTFPGGITAGGIALLGVADANGDGRPDAFLNIGHGASTTWVGLLTFDGRQLAAVVLDPMLLIGGSVRHQDAIECRSANGRMELVHRQISNYTANTQWDVVELVYAWSGSALSLASVERSDFRVSANFAGPPSGSYYGGIRCGALRLPA